jgi:lipoate-protein ligase A
MSVDDTLLEASLAGKTIPVLRLYAWQPACLSLGYAQPVQDANLPELEQTGWDLVRRPTGGKAILHTDELTYAVIGTQDDSRLKGSLLESYQVLAEALLRALQLLHIPAESLSRPSLVNTNDQKGPVCFEVPSSYEITVKGKKLVGSAQARRKHGVLQHGSLPLRGDLGRIIQALTFNNPAEAQQAEARLKQRATTVEEVLGYPLSWELVATAFSQAFSEVLNLNLVSSELTPTEKEQTQLLAAEKYLHRDWTSRV